MSGLVFVLEPERVLVAMDTLATNGLDGLPSHYASKLLPLPHLLGVICGTGSMQLALQWYLDVQSNVVARDFDFVNEIAPERLRSIAESLGDQKTTSTIYHFGFSRSAGVFAGTVFRSTAAYMAEPLQYGAGLKPPYEDVINVANDRLDELGLDHGLVDLLTRIKIVDDSLPTNERVGIGGEVHLMLLSGTSQITQVSGQWPGFDEEFAYMLERLSGMQDSSGA